MSRGENGATIEEMRSDYFEMFNTFWPLKLDQIDEIVQYLSEIHGLVMEKLDSGLCIWYIDDLGSSLSDRHMDSNNNVMAAEQQSSDSVEVQSDSHGFVAPLSRRQMVTTSSLFVSGNTEPSLSSSATSSTAVITSSASSDNSIETIENAPELAKNKRKLSNDDCSLVKKRIKPNATDRLPLIEKNLNLHNWNSGANGTVKQLITSTEKENSMLALNGAASDAIECSAEIEVASDSEYQAPIEGAAMKNLQQ